GQEQHFIVLVDEENGAGLRPAGEVVEIRFLNEAEDFVGADALAEQDDGAIEVLSKGFAAHAVFAKWNILSRQERDERSRQNCQGRDTPHIYECDTSPG